MSLLLIREPPPTRVGVEVVTPAGRRTVWAEDRPDGHNNPSGLRFGSGMPGGYEELSCRLPRRPGIDYGDMVRLSNVRAFLAGDETVWDGRLEDTPQSSGDEVVVEPKAVGHQAQLGDDKGFTEIYVDRDLSAWQGAGRQRRVNLYAAGYDSINDPSVQPDIKTGMPGLAQEASSAQQDPVHEAWYDAGAGNTIGSIYYDMVGRNLSDLWVGQVGTADDDVAAGAQSSADLVTTATPAASGTFTPTSGARWARLALTRLGATTGASDHGFVWRWLTVFGDVAIPKIGTPPNQGYLISDMLRQAIAKGAPGLRTTDESVPPTSFVVEQAAYKERTTVGQVVVDLARFEERDHFVFDDKLLCFLPRGTYGRKWIARASEANLKATGQSTARLWNGIYVRFQDSAGVSRVAGPPGSGADVESSYLVDLDPENEANQAGLKRHDMLDMRGISFDGGAIEVGRGFLAGARALDRSGQAQHVGIVQDDKGVWHSVAKMRAGDEVAYVDSSDPSYRRIVRVNYEHDSRTMAVDLDAPPEGLDALLERLQVVLTRLG